MIEVEVKLPIKSPESVRAMLLAFGFYSKGKIKEEDKYFDNDTSLIRTSGEALRIRTETDLQTGEVKSYITFKGKKLDKVSMSRPEYESFVEDGAALEKILGELGFHAVKPYVIKEREYLMKQEIHACMDEVEGLGSFLELEIVIPDNGSREYALSFLESILGCLGYSLKDTVRTSYLSMLMNTTDGDE